MEGADICIGPHFSVPMDQDIEGFDAMDLSSCEDELMRRYSLSDEFMDRIRRGRQVFSPRLHSLPAQYATMGMTDTVPESPPQERLAFVKNQVPSLSLSDFQKSTHSIGEHIVYEGPEHSGTTTVFQLLSDVGDTTTSLSSTDVDDMVSEPRERRFSSFSFEPGMDEIRAALTPK